MYILYICVYRTRLVVNIGIPIAQSHCYTSGPGDHVQTSHKSTPAPLHGTPCGQCIGQCIVRNTSGNRHMVWALQWLPQSLWHNNIISVYVYNEL